MTDLRLQDGLLGQSASLGGVSGSGSTGELGFELAKLIPMVMKGAHLARRQVGALGCSLMCSDEEIEPAFIQQLAVSAAIPALTRCAVLTYDSQLKEVSMLAAGVDGCRTGWICVSRDRGTGSVAWRRFGNAEALFAQSPRPTVLAIDIPIGLMEQGFRHCDRQAREFLGPRRGSVFPAPLRAVLKASSWEEACSIRHRIEGKRMSKQAWAIVAKIREVDRLLRKDAKRMPWVREVHPEVSFCAWNRAPLPYPKKKKPGQTLRQSLVEKHFGAAALRSVRDSYLKKDVADDDILDAFAALWTAERILQGEESTLPDQPPADSCGLRMEIVY